MSRREIHTRVLPDEEGEEVGGRRFSEGVNDVADGGGVHRADLSVFHFCINVSSPL